MRAIYWLFIAIGICLALILILRYIFRPREKRTNAKRTDTVFSVKIGMPVHIAGIEWGCSCRPLADDDCRY